MDRRSCFVVRSLRLSFVVCCCSLWLTFWCWLCDVCRSLCDVVCCRLTVVRRSLFVVRCWLPSFLLYICCSLLVVRWLLFVARCSLLVDRCLLFVCGVSFVVWLCVLCVVVCSLRVVRCVLFVACGAFVSPPFACSSLVVVVCLLVGVCY